MNFVTFNQFRIWNVVPIINLDMILLPLIYVRWLIFFFTFKIHLEHEIFYL